jgi:4-carboxymuconolactone decarboxylase
MSSVDEPNDRHRLALETQESLFGGTLERDFSEWPAEADLVGMWADMCYADSWARPALDIRTKSLLTVCIFLARGYSLDLLKVHIHNALKHGVSRQEMLDLFIHVTAYCGVPSTAGTWPAVRDMVVQYSDSKS